MMLHLLAVPSWHPDAEGADLDPDEPTPGFSSIEDALADVAAGKFVVVLDDEDRENEGDLIGAADKMTPESMHFMIRHSSGLVCVSVTDDTADRLELPLMVSNKENEDVPKTRTPVQIQALQLSCHSLYFLYPVNINACLLQPMCYIF